ncbi:hypothetical protein HN011_008296 [Eciton burchellii]|nr:hypothetical protein HN011_008296 [Eciton burchellii]
MILTTSALPHNCQYWEIILDRNRFESITEDLFAGCSALKSLSIGYNNISSISENAFRNLQQLLKLNLAYNRIVTLSPDVFQPVNNLSKLLIGYNPIADLPMTLFNPLNNLRSLSVIGVSFAGQTSVKSCCLECILCHLSRNLKGMAGHRSLTVALSHSVYQIATKVRASYHRRSSQQRVT